MTRTKSLRLKYNEEVKAALKEKFGYKNDMMIPRLHKIVLNMGVGEASHNSKIADAIQAQLTKIAGQRAVVTKAKKSIASYKLREGMPVGAMVTLRGERMYDFLQKLICVVLPRIRDFRGISAKSFDGRGNYTLGLKEQSLFPEIIKKHSIRQNSRDLQMQIFQTVITSIWHTRRSYGKFHS